MTAPGRALLSFCSWNHQARRFRQLRFNCEDPHARKPIDARRRDLLKFSGLGLVGGLATGVVAAETSSGHGTAGASRSGFVDVRHYGALGAGKNLDTAAIQSAIDSAAAAGGGLVFFPAGDYLSFSIRLKSFVHLHLGQGCRLIAADSPLPNEQTGYRGGTYDAAEPLTAWDAYQDYGHNHWHNSRIWGEEIHDISITGPGLIWGRGLSHGRGNQDDLGYKFIAEQPGVGNKAIALKNCHNVLFRDFSILKGGHFGLLLTAVDNMTIDNLKIDTDRDGMDIDCCKNVRVSNCTVNSPWDDGICPKSSFALGYARSTENVTITDCYVTGCYELGSVLDNSRRRFAPGAKTWYTGRIKCGTESNGGFRNITISDCVFEGCNGLALESMDGALLENIVVTNLAMRDIHQAPFFFRLGARLRGPQGKTQVGTLRGVLVSNVACFNAESKYSSIISGVPGHAIEDLKFSNIYIQHQGGGTAEAALLRPPENEAKYPDPNMFGPMPAQGFFFRHVRNLEMSHIEIQPMVPDLRPAMVLEDVNRADFYAITAPATVKNFALRNVADLRIFMSRAGGDTVLSAAADQLI